jgi:hypothetical protein
LRKSRSAEMASAFETVVHVQMVGQKLVQMCENVQRPKQKLKMSLVLDAARTPSHTFQQVLDAFRAQYREECEDAGFAQVWAVGPQDSLVERLDR